MTTTDNDKVVLPHATYIRIIDLERDWVYVRVDDVVRITWQDKESFSTVLIRSQEKSSFIHTRMMPSEIFEIMKHTSK